MNTPLVIDLESGGKRTFGFATPREDISPQKMRVPPRRVLPIVFIPGIMGTNLRTSPKRQAELGMSNNAVWRPDKLSEIVSLGYAAADRRQLQLDPETTEVDTYDPYANPTGSAFETSAQRNAEVANISVALSSEFDSPLLVGDPMHGCAVHSLEQKARLRGWGEVYFKSYRKLLETCEQALNSSAPNDHLEKISDVHPSAWMADGASNLQPISSSEISGVLAGCFFPVHALGYNWLKSNWDSARDIRTRVLAIINEYKSKGFQCEKVILLTHSMGGLVARALCHPAMGNLEDKVLGVVHGVLPALGAPAAYKRMRCGFDEMWKGFHPGPKIIGDEGREVTAVLANSPGALQLLPSKAYGNGWLLIRQGKTIFRSLPEKDDPYEEIYKVSGPWYGLLQKHWLNPAGSQNAGFDVTCAYLDLARSFHDQLGNYYHPQSFAHYGADAARPSWQSVVWNIDRAFSGSRWSGLVIVNDDEQGHLQVRPADGNPRFEGSFHICLGPAEGPGDETVPAKSADHQLLRGKFKGIFRQTGYEHQKSYNSDIALHSTLYSIVRIVQTMAWTSRDG